MTINCSESQAGSFEVSHSLPLQSNDRLAALKVERAALRQFCCLKGLYLNLTQAGKVTGCIGWGAGFLLGTFGVDAEERREVRESVREGFCAVGYAVTAIPGQIVGLITAPVRMMVMCGGRRVEYTSQEVEKVAHKLQRLQPQLEQYNPNQPTEAMKKFIDSAVKITRAYGNCKSESSQKLWDILRYGHFELPWHIINEQIIEYLTEQESPIEFLTFEAKPHLKNQGKKLFNCIMKEFLDDSVVETS